MPTFLSTFSPPPIPWGWEDRDWGHACMGLRDIIRLVLTESLSPSGSGTLFARCLPYHLSDLCLFLPNIFKKAQAVGLGRHFLPLLLLLAFVPYHGEPSLEASLVILEEKPGGEGTPFPPHTPPCPHTPHLPTHTLALQLSSSPLSPHCRHSGHSDTCLAFKTCIYLGDEIISVSNIYFGCFYDALLENWKHAFLFLSCFSFWFGLVRREGLEQFFRRDHSDSSFF